MDVEALTKRLRAAYAEWTNPRNESLPVGAGVVIEAADALTALSADLSLAQAAAETARTSSDHWEARAKELERERDEHLRLKNELVLKAYPAMDRADALAAEVERLRGLLNQALEEWEEAAQYKGDYLMKKHGDVDDIAKIRAALEGKDNG